MDCSNNATANSVAVAFLVALNSALLLATSWWATRQRTRIEGKLDANSQDTKKVLNGHGSDAPE